MEDVREPQELKDNGKIPNALNLPLSSLQETLKLSEQAFHDKFEFSKPEKNKVSSPTDRGVIVGSDILLQGRSKEYKRKSNSQRSRLHKVLSSHLISTDFRIGNYKGSFDDWLARSPPLPNELTTSKGTVAKAA